MIKKITLLLLITLFSSSLLQAANKRQKQFHRFLTTYNTLRYPHVITGKITRIIPNGYHKGRMRFDVLQVQITTPIRGMKKNNFTHLLFRKRNFNFKTGEHYLFFATKVNRLSFIDPPLRIKGRFIRIDTTRYPLKKALDWAKAYKSIRRRNFLKSNRRFLRAKRTRDRKAAFRLKMIRKEALLLYKINNPASLKEKVSYLLELGHNRIRLKEYKKAGNAFRFVKREYRVAEIVPLIAERGLALLRYYTDGTKSSISYFQKILKKPAGTSGYRAVLHLDLGRLYEKAGKARKAVEQYTKAATLFPTRYKERAFALFNMGEIARKNRQYRLALTHFRKSLTIFNRHIAAAFRKGNTRFPTWYFILKRRIRKRGK